MVGAVFCYSRQNIILQLQWCLTRENISIISSMRDKGDRKYQNEMQLYDTVVPSYSRDSAQLISAL